MKWTQEQRQAIETKDGNLLVAAGAGSGKTAVLVERILHRMEEDKIGIDRLLVVTFTNAAASEMRERIASRMYDEIEKKPELQKQISLMGKASIMTIDAFCLKVVRDNFFKVGLDPNFRIGDTAEMELIKLEALEELLEEKYDQDDEEFNKIVAIYMGEKDDEELRNIVLKIYNYTQSAPYPHEWLEKQVEAFHIEESMPIEETRYGKILMQEAKEELKNGIEELKDLELSIMDCPEAANYCVTIQSDIQALTILEEKCTTWDDMYFAIRNFDFERLKICKNVPEEVKKQVTQTRDKIKDVVKKYLREKVFLSESAFIREDFHYLYTNLKLLCKLVKEFEQKFNQKKLEKNIVDFADIEHKALQLLQENEEICRMYKEQYEEIFIDEYQDSNMMQEIILNTISKGHMFMVGDVKQSIYRFRQARPDLFLGKYQSFPNLQDGLQVGNHKILLFKNFRSNQNIIDATNDLFKQIMSKDCGEMDYTEEEFLRFGAMDYSQKGEPAEINFIETKKVDEETMLSAGEAETTLEEAEESDLFIDSNARLEGKVIAHKIRELVGKLEVYDKKTKNTRLATYQDFVILLRSTVGSLDIFMEELTMQGIPVYADSTGGYFQQTEVQIVLALLNILDNPMQDIPLLAVLRSQIGDFTMDELTQIRLIDRSVLFYEAMQRYVTVGDALSKKVWNFLEKLSAWREKTKYMSLSELLWLLYNETGYYDYVSLFPDGLSRQANLKLLLERAEAYEKTSFRGLFHFLNYIQHMKESSGDMETSKVIGENENVVRIMSIHKSKGLEFPVVILAGTTKKFNYRDLNDSLIFHSDLGFGADVINPETRIRYPSISKIALARKMKQETLAEEMRILYVALTRAREKLIVTALVPDLEKAYMKYTEKLTAYKIEKASCFMDWIGLATIEKVPSWTVKQYSYQEVLQLETREEVLCEKVDALAKEERNVAHVANQMNWVYPYRLATGIPSKISISELKRMASKEEGQVEEQNQFSLIEKPDFLAEKIESGSQYGTLVHNALQKLNFKEFSPDLSAEDRKQMLLKIACDVTQDTKIQNSILRKLVAFTQTDLFAEIRKATQIMKETSFNLNLSAKEVFQIESDEKIMIQGIIDLYFVEKSGSIVLVDYKTDFVESAEELIHRYHTQLEYYKRALEEITNRKVRKTVLYSLKLEKEIEI